jgi:hypothetical protein
LGIALACGTALTAPAADVWQTGNYNGAPGMDNFVSKPIGTLFLVAFVQHEPGAFCTTSIDYPFMQNLDDCLRYFTKSYNYGTTLGTVTAGGCIQWYQPNNAVPNSLFPWSFRKTMAKTSITVTGYSPVTGAINTVADLSGAVDRAISGIVSPGDSGFGGFQLTTSPGAGSQMRCHYTADSGW